VREIGRSLAVLAALAVVMFTLSMRQYAKRTA
jgi:hypothetical protein